MQFYKKRDFGELISSTFDFVKIYGLNYFKNYILLNGMILILLLVVIFIGYGEFIQQFFGSNLSNETYLFEDYFLHNQEILIIVAIISAFLFLLFSLVTYSYPILYMKRVAENGTLKVTAEEKRIAIKAAKAMNLKVAGVDIIRSAKGPLLLEVNSSPGLEGIEGATGKDIAGEMIKAIEKSFKWLNL